MEVCSNPLRKVTFATVHLYASIVMYLLIDVQMCASLIEHTLTHMVRVAGGVREEVGEK